MVTVDASMATGEGNVRGDSWVMIGEEAMQAYVAGPSIFFVSPFLVLSTTVCDDLDWPDRDAWSWMHMLG